MNEETKPSEEPVEETKTETQNVDPLQEVYDEEGINVDEAAQQFTAQPAQTVPQPQPDYTDDYDGQQQAALVGQINESLDRVSVMEQRLADDVYKADISKAVEHISKQIEGVDSAVIEAHLQAQGTKDPRFKALWDNRQANPGAWQKGVDAMGRKMQGIFTVKQDPQLTENQRAAKQSQQTMAATNNTQSDDWVTMSEKQIDEEVAAIKRDGS